MTRKFQLKNILHLLIIIFILSANVQGEDSLLLYKQIPFSSEFESKNITPDIFFSAPDGFIYFLDTESRQIASISSNKEFRFGGGAGAGLDALFDPVGIVVYYPDIWVADRSNNSLLKYDYRLNYTGKINHEGLYPSQLTVDPFGNLIVYSERSNTAHTIINGNVTATPFIDFNDHVDGGGEIEDWYFSQDGELGVLMSSVQELLIFNRLGRLLNRFHVNTTESGMVVKFNNEWLVIDSEGTIEHVSDDYFTAVRSELGILDVQSFGNELFLLTKDKILIYRVRADKN